MAIAVAAVTSLPLAAAESPTSFGRVLQSPGGSGIALIESGDGYRVERLDGSLEKLDVPPGTRLTAFHELEEGWIAAGFRWMDTGRNLVLLRREGESVELLSLPPGGENAQRGAPVLLVARGRLWGLAWLEGDGGERNAVLAALWNGDGWGPAETVSPLTGEAQLSPSGAVLENGTVLLVWAAVDGHDDEIMWSLSDGASWSPPARVHADNDVPDIVPTVVSAAGGALVAWSQYDGKDYRLRLSRFADGAWLDAGMVGEEGSFRASLFPTPTGAGFLYQVTTPYAWGLMEVDAHGRVMRRASLGRHGWGERPLVASDGSGVVRLRAPADVGPERVELTELELPWVGLEWVEEP